MKRLYGLSLGVLWIAGSLLLLYLASLDLYSEVQLIWTAAAVLIMIILRHRLLKGGMAFEPLRFARLMIMLLAGMITLRYLWWRTFHSLPLDADIYSMIGGFMLYFAEVQAAIIFFLGSVVYLAPKQRDPEPVSLEGGQELPSVDVLVPTCNESIELLRVTLLACTNLRYPADKLHIHLLDDGGTEQRRNDPDPEKAAAACARHEAFAALCAELGVNYLARRQNNHAKAGNINAALPHINGELVLILDCDHVPSVDLLENTVGPFLRDERLWLVQTPHFLINDDPIEKNLGRKADMPSESELFYTSTMRGMDAWNAAFFCGSGGLIRRRCLDELGGICTRTVTEDIETSVEMHARGYNSIYIHRPFLAGLQPETFSGFITQRLRWAHGMLQVFMLKNPLFKRGLGFWQRLCYLNMVGYWFFSYMRLVFLLAPMAYLIFGIRLYDASVREILIYGLPHLASFVIYFNVFFGRLRWFLVSEVYETLQSLFAIRTVFRVLLHPGRGQFVVTPKDESIEEHFVTPLAPVYYPLVGLLGLTLVLGVVRVFEGGEDWQMNLAVTFWCLLNFLVVVASLGALYERRQVRRTTRFAVDIEAELGDGGGEGRISDLSASGCCFNGESGAAVGDRVTLRAYCSALGRVVSIPASVHARFSGAVPALGLRFLPQTLAAEREVIALAYGDGEVWRTILKRRNVRFGLVDGLICFFTEFVPQGFRQIGRELRSLFAGGRSVKKRVSS